MYYVYILTNEHGNVMYVGITNNLERRYYEHSHEVNKGFTERYHVHKLVYYETTNDVKAAIAREKQLKGYSRKKKELLIDSVNPERKNLYIHVEDEI